MTDPADVLANRAWLRRKQPFPHIVAHDVFKPDFYAALSAQLRGILGCGLSDAPVRGRFSRSFRAMTHTESGLITRRPDRLLSFSPPLGAT
jgi:hypothetical protein